MPSCTLTVESSDAVANFRSVHEKDAARTESPCARIAWQHIASNKFGACSCFKFLSKLMHPKTH